MKIILLILATVLTITSVNAYTYDLNNDLVVDIEDLIEYSNYFGENNPYYPYNPELDYNDDLKINILDMIILTKYFGTVNELLAFPSAEGFGKYAKGGRGGEVIHVTNLNAVGPGSFYEAVNSQGPRTVVFDIGGTIELTEKIFITEPYLTVAGQTAPGDGITIKGAGIVINTHDVIIRGLRIRVGDAIEGPSPDNRDAFFVSGTHPYNIIIDHNSFSWAIDENVGVWNNASNITYQWNIISEALNNSLHPEGEHSKGMLIGPGAKYVSIHHNLFAHNVDRNPLIGGGNTANIELPGPTHTETINNIIYNYRWNTISYTKNLDGISITPSFHHAIKNFIIKGPNSLGEGPLKILTERINPGTKLYVEGNIGPLRPDNSLNEWDIVAGDIETRSEQKVFLESGIVEESAFEAYESVLNNAGAKTTRDLVDERILFEVKNIQGSHINSQEEIGGWPILDSGTAIIDTDRDGMPDSWELNNGLNPLIPDNNNDRNNDGYTNLEEYLDSLIVYENQINTCNLNLECENYLGENYNSCSDCFLSVKERPFILFNNDLISETNNNLENNPYWRDYKIKHLGMYTDWKLYNYNDFDINFVSDSFEGDKAIKITDLSGLSNNFIYQDFYLDDLSSDYELRFLTKSDDVIENKITFQQFNAYTWLSGKNCLKEITPEWTEHTCLLESTEFNPDFEYLRIVFPASTGVEGSSFFDNIKLIKINTGEDLVINGDFENSYQISNESLNNLGTYNLLVRTVFSFVGFHKIIEEEKIENINLIIDKLLSYPIEYNPSTPGFYQRSKIYAMAVIYDSYYNEIDPVRKENLRREISSLTEYLNSVLDSESKWFLETTNPQISGGHNIHAREVVLPAMLTVYGDCEVEENCTGMLKSLVKIYEEDYNPYQNYVYDEGASHIGFTYNGYQNFDPIYFWESAVNDRSWLSQEINDLQLSKIYALQHTPFSFEEYGEYPTFGDSYYIRSNREFTSNFPRIAYFFNNPYVNNFINEYSQRNAKYYEAKDLLNFLFYYDSIKNKESLSFDNLALSKNFGNSGFVIMRDDFDFESDTSMVFKSTRFMTLGHNHRDLNSFTLYYKTPLLIDSGEYAGTTGNNHYLNYYSRTIAHNSLLVYDPNEDFGSLENDGGQKNIIGYFNNLEELQNERFVDGIIKFYDEENLTYTVGDATKAYSEKISGYNRSILFLRYFSPPIIIVKDDVSINENLNSKILYHTINRPVVTGNSILVYEGEGEALINIFGDDIAYEIIGGPGYEYYYNGINHLPEAEYRNIRPEAGNWRIEISDNSEDNHDTIFSIIEVANRGLSGNKNIERVNNGFLIENIAVIFSNSSIQEYNFKSTYEKIILIGEPETNYELIQNLNTITIIPNSGNYYTNSQGVLIT